MTAPETTPPEAKKSKSTAVVQAGAQVKPLIPTDIDSAWRLAAAFAASGMLPKSYYEDKNYSADAKAFTAMQIGAEVGLNPITAIQSIAVVNGVATLWGDTQKALVLASGKADYVREGYEGDDPFIRTTGNFDDKKPNLAFKAWCETSRGGEVTRQEYSVLDAIDAGLWGKDIWKKHPKRMLRYKARAFVLRDVYPDVLKGLTHSYEEMQGEDLIDVTPARADASHLADNDPAGNMNRLIESSKEPEIVMPKQSASEMAALNAALENRMAGGVTLVQEPAKVEEKPVDVMGAMDALRRESAAIKQKPDFVIEQTEPLPNSVTVKEPVDKDPRNAAYVEKPAKQPDLLTGDVDTQAAKNQAEKDKLLDFNIKFYRLDTVAGATSAANDLLTILKGVAEEDRQLVFSDYQGREVVKALSAKGQGQRTERFRELGITIN